MKKSILIVLGLIFCVQFAQGQVKESANDDNQYSNDTEYTHYNFRSKKQLKTGLILFGVGSAALIAGIAIASSVDSAAGFIPLLGGGLLVVVGGSSVLVSIPFLISSGVNKRKAKVSVNTGSTGINGLPNFNSRYVSLGVSINIWLEGIIIASYDYFKYALYRL